MSPGYETKFSRSLTSPKRNGFGHPHLSSKVALIIGKNDGGVAVVVIWKMLVVMVVAAVVIGILIR